MKATFKALLPIFILAFRCSLFAKDTVPPFVADGTVSMKIFLPGELNPHEASEAKFSFYSSNDWWVVEIKPVNPKKDEVLLENCMRISDGSRRYTLFKDDTRTNAMKMAIVCPTPFPPPGHIKMFATWLGLCPNPELTLIDGNRMRRFPLVPSCSVDLFNSPQNEGTYGLAYLLSQNVFISELNITNNGMSLDLGNDFEDEIKKFPPPFDKGFLELSHKVLQTTNVNGFTFPARTALKLMYPHDSAKVNGKSNVHFLIEISVTRISFSQSDFTRRATAPTKLFAEDVRPPNLPKHSAVEYVVENDQWKPISDPDIRHRAFMERQRAVEK